MSRNKKNKKILFPYSREFLLFLETFGLMLVQVPFELGAAGVMRGVWSLHVKTLPYGPYGPCIINLWDHRHSRLIKDKKPTKISTIDVKMSSSLIHKNLKLCHQKARSNLKLSSPGLLLVRFPTNFWKINIEMELGKLSYIHNINIRFANLCLINDNG